MAGRKPGRTRRQGAALYELMGGGPPADEEVYLDAGAEAGRSPLRFLSPGRAVTFPVGHLLIALALVGAAVIGAYVVGSYRAETRLRAAFEQELLHRVGEPVAQDPLGRAEADLPGGQALAPGAIPPAEPTEGDPRRPGYRYFVLMETNSDGARRLAEFCDANGLETAVVPSHNSPLRRLVIALPGFRPELSMTDPAVSALKSRIRDVGGRWKRNRSGTTDLHDAYLLEHRP